MEDQDTARIKEIKKLLNTNSNEANFEERLKPFRQSKAFYNKKIETLVNFSHDQHFKQKILKKEELRKLLMSVSEAQMLPEAILNLSAFHSFELCQVLIHEKGKPVGQNHIIAHKLEKRTRLIATQNFNFLFNLVKKSKNKIFHQSETLREDLDILGSFLAKEIELKNYSVLYIISRNSFLPPSAFEQSEFQNLGFFLHPLLTRILDKEKNDFKKDVLKKALEQFPEKICVKKDDTILFSNKNQETSPGNSNLMIFPFSPEENTTIELSNFSKDQISTELYHSQRVSLLGELLNTLQHELSNPLFGLSLTSSLLESEIFDVETKNILLEISQNANRSQTIINNFSNLYSAQEAHKKINLYKLVEEVITLTKSETKEINKSIQCIDFTSKKEAETLEVSTNSSYLTHIIFNLIINSTQAIKGFHDLKNFQGSILLLLQKTPDSIIISVVDNGPGIKPENINAIFQPFFTTKEAGTGLGLSICQNLAQRLGTKIEFKNNSPLLGATFSISLPC